MKALTLILPLLLIASIYGSVESDAVKSIPDYSFRGRLYSGYHDVSNVKKFHYMFNDAYEDPENKPLVLWLNGGPGCSSLFGMLGEIGPVTADNYGGEFKLNPYSWNLEANLLFIEQPAGVGFSTAYDLKHNWTDVENAKNLFAALKDFFNTFPELKGRKFNIAGESYAGIFIPHLASEILEDESEDKINLEGFLAANPLTDPKVDYDRSLAEFGFWRGIVSAENYNKFQKNCPHLPDEIRPLTDTEGKYQDFDGHVSHKCNEARLGISENFNGNDLYGIYRKCPLYEEENELIKYRIRHSYKNTIYRKLKKYFLKLKDDSEEEDGLWPSYMCGEDLLIDNFLNLNATKEKLHVSNYSVNWTQCAYLNYEWSDSIHLYNTTLLKYPEVKKWIMSGTEDGVISTIGTMRWIHKIGFNVDTEWKQWKNNGQVAGYVQTYKEGLTLVTVKGAGHMVPQDKRQETKIVLDAFFEGKIPE